MTSTCSRPGMTPPPSALVSLPMRMSLRSLRLHRLESPQHRAAQARQRSRMEGERVRSLRRGTTAGQKERGGDLPEARPFLRPARAARGSRRNRARVRRRFAEARRDEKRRSSEAGARRPSSRLCGRGRRFARLLVLQAARPSHSRSRPSPSPVPARGRAPCSRVKDSEPPVAAPSMQDRQPGFAGGIELLGRNGPQLARARPPSK